MAKNFAELRAKMAVSARDEAQRQTHIMLAEIATEQTAQFFAERTGAAKRGDLAHLLLQVKARKPLAGDEMPK